MILIWFISALLLFMLPGIFFMKIALRRRKGGKRSASGGPESFRMEREWLKQAPQQAVYISAQDGLRLHARLLAQGGARRFVIVCHGYRAHSASAAAYARGFYERGWSLLLPDARAHGESEGKWIGMGWPERKDVLAWIEEINRRYDAPEILLFGVSMGGATVLNTAGEALPGNVRGVISDCGFVSVRDEFTWQLRNFYRLPAAPFLYSAEPFCRMLAGWSLLRDGDSCTQLARCRLPLLLIHGEDDRFVPPQMLSRAYDAASCPKYRLTVPKAAHAQSIVRAPQAYWAAVDAFISAALDENRHTMYNNGW